MNNQNEQNQPKIEKIPVFSKKKAEKLGIKVVKLSDTEYELDLESDASVSICFKAKKDFAKDLDRFSRKQGLPRSEIIREAIRRLLQEEGALS
jgi:hypothetical protein